jgi:hypothetical protein
MKEIVNLDFEIYIPILKNLYPDYEKLYYKIENLTSGF